MARFGGAVALMVAVAACGTSAQSSRGAYAASVQRALEYLPDNETLDWVDPETEELSRVTVLNTTQTSDGRYCRDLTFETVPVAVEDTESQAPGEEEAESTALEPAAPEPAAAAVAELQTYCRDGESGAWEPEDPDVS